MRNRKRSSVSQSSRWFFARRVHRYFYLESSTQGFFHTLRNSFRWMPNSVWDAALASRAFRPSFSSAATAQSVLRAGNSAHPLDEVSITGRKCRFATWCEHQPDSPRRRSNALSLVNAITVEVGNGPADVRRSDLCDSLIKLRTGCPDLTPRLNDSGERADELRRIELGSR